MTERPARKRDPNAVSVRIGDLAVGDGDTSFKTLLGSCVGVALYDRKSRVGGLAHVVLPSSVGHTGPPGKFVDTAIPELIARIEQIGGQRRNLNAKLAGGANMFSSAAAETIGDKNLEAIHRELSARSIPVIASHCGGTQGQRMTFKPATGVVRIEVVGSDAIEI